MKGESILQIFGRSLLPFCSVCICEVVMESRRGACVQKALGQEKKKSRGGEQRAFTPTWSKELAKKNTNILTRLNQTWISGVKLKKKSISDDVNLKNAWKLESQSIYHQLLWNRWSSVCFSHYAANAGATWRCETWHHLYRSLGSVWWQQ